MDIQRAIAWLVEHEGLRRPHGYMPGSRPGTLDTEFTEATWGIYRWSQVGLAFGMVPRDPGASPKPSWDQLVAANAAAALTERRTEHLHTLRAECRARITAAYGAMTFEEEVELRLRGDHTAAQDTERERMRERYRELRDLVPYMNERTLARFDPAADAAWAKPPPDLPLGLQPTPTPIPEGDQ